ncbi:YkgJ family cysteine cluster protein [Deefgea rivuli]|uniref:YkgJ family cysteine cluster protein n=1 Tax=Deefgea rivuli TaxID=400948 RepID=UPI00056A0360|nr:YkgJ family cysteine cluster protein [Deefgea rivuli]
MTFQCRPLCAACCTAPSISSPIPGMPNGKPAGVACIQLDEKLSCKIFGQPERPAVCAGLKPSFEMCGNSKTEAMLYLTQLEIMTAPQVF